MQDTADLTFDMQKKLNMIKGFRTGASSLCPNKMVVNYNEKQFLVSIEEVDKVDNLYSAIDKYLIGKEVVTEEV